MKKGKRFLKFHNALHKKANYIFIALIIAISIFFFVHKKGEDLKQNEDFPYDIDLVIAWRNESDKHWIEEMEKYSKKYGIKYPKNQNHVDYLKLTLRSIEKNMPWVNTIHIITDNQYPDWIKRSHEKLNFIDYRTTFNASYGMYNKETVYFSLDKIKELSEHFAIIEDGLVVTKPTTRSIFFDDNECPTFRGKVLSFTPSIKTWSGIRKECTEESKKKLHHASFLNSYFLANTYEFPDYNMIESSRTVMPFMKQAAELLYEEFNTSYMTRKPFLTCDSIDFSTLSICYAFENECNSYIDDLFYIKNADECQTIDFSLVWINFYNIGVCGEDYYKETLKLYPKSSFEI